MHQFGCINFKPAKYSEPGSFLIRCLTYGLLAIFMLLDFYKAHSGTHLTDYHIRHYMPENGLPQSSVKGIAVDQDGFYWLATEMGLVRFDGRSFKLFNKTNTALGSNRFVGIIKNPRNGQLLGINERYEILTVKNGTVSMFKANMERLFNLPEQKLDQGFYFHRTWKFNTGNDIYATKNAVALPMPGNNGVLLTKKKIHWFSAGRPSGTLPLDQELDFRTVFNIGDQVYELLSDEPGNQVRVFTPAGISVITLRGDILQQKSSGRRVLCFNNASEQVFIVLDDCLYLVERDNKGTLNTRLLLSGFSFMGKAISSSYYDSVNDIIFLGSMVDGLYVFSKKYFNAKSIADAPAYFNVVQDQIVYNDSSILTDKGIVFSTGNAVPAFVPQLKAPVENFGSWLVKVGKDTIWAASGNTLRQYANNGSTLLRKWTIPDYIFSELEVANGEVFIGNTSGGVSKMDFDHNKPRLACTVKGHVQTIEADGPYLWVGTDEGLFRVNRSDYKFSSISTFEGKTVRGLYFLGKDELWVCTYDAGFYLFSQGKWTHFPTDRNGYLNSAHCIMEDNKGFLWISTNHGLFQARKSDLLSYARGLMPAPYYLYYSKDAGFSTNEFNGGNSKVGVKLPNGYFGFSSMKGWVYFHPDSTRYILPDKSLIIDKIEIGNKELPAEDSLVLDKDFNRLIITFATAYFGNADNLHMEYRLDNSEWVAIENGQVIFNALPSGKHILQVRKRAGFQNKYTHKTIVLTVNPAWWETWVFKMAIAVLLILFIWFVFKLRFLYLKGRNEYLEKSVAKKTQELKENIQAVEQSKEQLRKELVFQERLNKHIAHDIRTPLKYLTFSSKHLYKKIKNNETPDADDAFNIYTSSEQIFHFADKLINYLSARTATLQSKEDVNLYEVVEQKLLMFNLAAKERNNKLINKVMPYQTFHTHAQLFEILLHNLIDNSIKNTHDGVVIVHSEQNEQEILITVADSGRGMSDEEIKEYNNYFNQEGPELNKNFVGLGFSVIRNMLPQLEASLTIKPNTGSGIVFCLLIRQ